MAIELSTNAKERSTYRLTVTFFDERTPPVAVTPNSITWTLSDINGTVINSREDVSVTPASTVNIILRGDDLALDSAAYNADRIVTVKATYDSTAGSDLPLNEEIRFSIDDLQVIQ